MEPFFKVRKNRLDLFRKHRMMYPLKPNETKNHEYICCSACQESMLFEDFMKNQYVCPNCGHYMVISAHERIRQIVDEGTFRELDKGLTNVSKQTFPGYQAKLMQLQKTTGLYEAVIYGTGKIKGHHIVLAVMDNRFLMGSMGQAVGEKITRSIEYATKKKLPLLIFSTSGGARMQEGILSLVQMAKTSAALAKHDEAGLLFISYLTHPTTGGVSASFAMLGDVILAEPNCLIGFAGKRVIASTLNRKLPDTFQKAEFVLEKGFIDRIVERKEASNVLASILAMHERSTS